jgi:hypothetical protein
VDRLAVNSRKVNKETVLVYMQVVRHAKQITLDVIAIVVNKAILEKTWFAKHNPSVN